MVVMVVLGIAAARAGRARKIMVMSRRDFSEVTVKFR
jgi:hypothetical protein